MIAAICSPWTKGWLHVAAVALCVCSICSAQATRTIVFRAFHPDSSDIVTGLKAGDIRVADGGEVRPVNSLRFGASPMDLVLVLDLGADTVAGARYIARGARLACSELAGGDRLGLVTFAKDRTIQFPLTAGGYELGFRVERAVVDTDWAIRVQVYDALQTALGLFSDAVDPGRTRAVIIVTNSPDYYPKKEGSKSEPAAIIAAARLRQAALFAVILPPLGSWQRPRRDTILGIWELPERESQARGGGYLADFAYQQLRQVAEPTGGEARMWIPSGYILRQSFERALQRYVATYAPSPSSNGRPSVQLTPEASAAFPGFEIGGAW